MRRVAEAALALVLLSSALSDACGGRGATRDVSLAVQLPFDVPVAATAITVTPASAVRASHLFPSSRLTLVADSAASALTLRAPGLCSLEVPTAPGAPPAVATPFIDLGADASHAQVGFDAPFDLDVVAGCDEAKDGEVRWRQIEGPAVLDLRVTSRGFHLHGRTRPLAELRPGPLPWGIVPLSPRTQGRYVLEATWSGHGAEVRRQVIVTSMARATGVPSIALGQRVLLGGEGWKVRQAPPHGGAQVVSTGGGASFEADAPGAWRLEDGEGREMQVRAGLHDRTPLDCGRGGCHAPETEAATSSPMTHALERFFDADPTAGGGCMLDCHVAGERGVHDGGFLDLAQRLGRRVDLGPWQELPRALRRVGGVTCTACHGPAAIPDKTARRSALSSDVCATCHDAPPSYVHVAQWRTSRMARADHAPAVRASAACARCHTTEGFLGATIGRKADDTPDDGKSVGIACAACHAPHGAHVGETLVRAVSAPDALGGKVWSDAHAESALCVACHAPGKDDVLPSASAGSLWLGRVLLPGGELFSGKSAHDAVGGCTACHGGTRPTDHSFRVDPAACASCHAGEPREVPDAQGRTIRDRALALWKGLGAEGAEGAEGTDRGPPHATPPVPSQGTRARALYEVALVLEDPGAAAHNAGFARRLLDDAEAQVRAP